MLHIGQFRELVVDHALKAIDLYSEGASELVLGTAIQESGLRYLRQLGNGPALGLFQMEPETHADLWANFLNYRPDLAGRVRSLCATPTPEALAGNLWYAAAMCRVHYYRVPEALPSQGDIDAQALFWKANYNTFKGKGKTADYIANWRRVLIDA